MIKRAIHGNQAREKFVQAATALFTPVASTLGPKGKSVIISHHGAPASATKDGVKVAGEIESEDPFIYAGIQIIREAARKTVEDAGDGTTTSTILAYTLINELDKEIKAELDSSTGPFLKHPSEYWCLKFVFALIFIINTIASMATQNTERIIFAALAVLALIFLLPKRRPLSSVTKNNPKHKGNILTIKEQINKDLQACVSHIRELSVPFVQEGKLDLIKVAQLATTSANNDNQIGGLFSMAYEVIGIQGSILLAESKRPGYSYIEATSGMKQDRGYSNPNFATGPEKCDYEAPYYFVTDKVISQQKDIERIAAFSFTNKRPLIIICSDLIGEALGYLNMNRIKAGLEVTAVTFPSWRRASKELIEDIAIYTGAVFCTEDNGINVDNISPSQIPTILGQSVKFTSTPKDCIIIDGHNDETTVNNRVAEIQAQITPGIHDLDKEQLLARKSKLQGGVAILYAGGTTEVERKETLDRCEDAILAVRSAFEEGYLPGGGKGYLLCLPLLSNDSILKRALPSITNQICFNADVEPAHLLSWLAANPDLINHGYNAKAGVMEDLCAAGVVDSAKVVRVALENAVSIALQFLATDCIIAEFKQ